MQAFMIGLIAVGLFFGVLLGRDTTKATRARKDRDGAKGTYEKSIVVAKTAIKKAASTIFVVAAGVAGLFFVAWTLGSR